MSWPEKKPPESDAAEKKTLGKGVFRKCDGCGETLPADAFAAHFEVCPQCGTHHKLGAQRWRELLLDDGQPRRVGRPPRAGRPARVRRRQDLPRARRVGAEVLRAPRTPSRSVVGADRRAAHRVGGVPLRLHGRLDGQRRGREDHAPLRARDRRAAAGRAAPGVGRRPDAGGHPEPDADGQDRWRALERLKEAGLPFSACCFTRRPAASRRASRCSGT